MTTVMIVGIVSMVAHLMLRIGILLVAIWGGVRLIDRFRTPIVQPASPTMAPAMVPPSNELAAPATTEIPDGTDSKKGA
ncbi:MAG: hypothetical protein EBS29_14950 [Chloroflexia bacterium]|nr:hypothetical protein [Chloroflexia bacterium]